MTRRRWPPWPTTHRTTSPPSVQDFRTTLRVVTAEAGESTVEISGDEGTAQFEAELGLQGLGTWAYDGRVDLVEVDGEWKVRLTSPSLHPEVGEGDRLQRNRSQGLRAPIVAAGGQPLAVGGPGEEARLDAIAGPLLGQLRTLTAEEATQRGLRYAEGDLVGADGVEAGFEAQLGGSPFGRIEVVDGEGGPTEVLEQFVSERPEPLYLTLDYATQRAAEAAVADAVPAHRTRGHRQPHRGDPGSGQQPDWLRPRPAGPVRARFHVEDRHGGSDPRRRDAARPDRRLPLRDPARRLRPVRERLRRGLRRHPVHRGLRQVVQHHLREPRASRSGPRACWTTPSCSASTRRTGSGSRSVRRRSRCRRPTPRSGRRRSARAGSR